QVITVSNITNATGDRLLASAMAGFRDNQRSSTLLWPDIPQPPSSHWNTWKVFLQFFSRGSHLNQALGPWENRPHYEWRWFVDSVHNVWTTHSNLEPVLVADKCLIHCRREHTGRDSIRRGGRGGAGGWWLRGGGLVRRGPDTVRHKHQVRGNTSVADPLLMWIRIKLSL
ncbi:MAG: hypothetical protein ACK53Y_14905, partial [bacterium]